MARSVRKRPARSKPRGGADLGGISQHFRLLSDPTRLRLLILLEREELSVAELAAITQLAQPRVSTHLAKLRDAGLVNDRREGVFVYYRGVEHPSDPALASLWEAARANASDPLIEQDLERIPQVLSARHGDSWADTVAGDMERHYSPGRTWEATARALALLVRPGKVLDIASGDGALAELMAPGAESILCIDSSERVVAAAERRLGAFEHVTCRVGDMHDLPVDDGSIDTALLMHALTYTKKPAVVISEAARALSSGGHLLAATLEKHRHEKAVSPYDHRNLGFTERQLHRWCVDAGLEVAVCRVASVEKRAPNFAVLTLLAVKP